MTLLPFIPYRRRHKDREIPKAAYAVCLALLLLQTSAMFGQAAYVRAVDSKTVTVSAQPFVHENTIGELNINVEYLISGSPTITSIVFQGCMRGGSCQTLSTYTGQTSTVVAVTGLYDRFLITPTWTGGTNPSVTFNWLGTANSSPSSLSVVVDPCQSNTVAKSKVFASITTATTTALVAVSGTTQIYVCGYTLSMTGTTTPNTLIFQQGTGATCAGAPTAISMTHRGGGTASSAFNYMSVGYAGQSVLVAAASNGLCVLTTVATSPQIDVQVSYVQQ